MSALSLHIESTNSMIESIMPQPELTKRQEVQKTIIKSFAYIIPPNSLLVRMIKVS